MSKNGHKLLVVEGKDYSERRLYILAIRRDPHFPKPFGCLATLLHPFQAIEIKRGMVLTTMQLFLESIHLDPLYLPVYHNLGRALANQRTPIRLYNGIELKPTELLAMTEDKIKQLLAGIGDKVYALPPRHQKMQLSEEVRRIGHFQWSSLTLHLVFTLDEE